MYQKIISICVGLLLGATSCFADTASKPAKFVQDRFVITLWVDPPIKNRDMEQTYKDIADANFTVMFSGYGGNDKTFRTAETMINQLKLCEKYGLVQITRRCNFPADEQFNSPADWGRLLKDEPSGNQIKDCAEKLQNFKKIHPGKLGFINLFPSYASADTFEIKGVSSPPTYENYVKYFVYTVKPDVLSMDYYPNFRPDEDPRDGYCNNLAIMRKYSLLANIPFWNFFHTMPFGSDGERPEPTEAQMRWMAYASLTYGAKGLAYFCYSVVPGYDQHKKGYAIETIDGRKTRIYHSIKRLNRGIKALGPTLMQLTSTDVLHLRPGENAGKVLRKTPILDISKPEKYDYEADCLVGVFKHTDGRQAVMLMNYRPDYTGWYNVQFRAPIDKITEVDKNTGKEIKVVDDAIPMKGLQISLDAGEARLFLIGK